MRTVRTDRRFGDEAPPPRNRQTGEIEPRYGERFDKFIADDRPLVEGIPMEEIPTAGYEELYPSKPLCTVTREEIFVGREAKMIGDRSWAGLMDVINEIRETEDIGHACEIETSISLYLFPEAVNMEAMKGKVYERKRDLDVYPAQTPVDWMANWPEAPAGIPEKATREKGGEIGEGLG